MAKSPFVLARPENLRAVASLVTRLVRPAGVEITEDVASALQVFPKSPPVSASPVATGLDNPLLYSNFGVCGQAGVGGFQPQNGFVRRLHTLSNQEPQPEPMKPKLDRKEQTFLALIEDLDATRVAESCKDFSTFEIARRLVLLGAMQVTSLHPVVMTLMDQAEHRPGGMAQKLLMPWFNLFCQSGSVNDMVSSAKQQYGTAKGMIFDYAQELIKDPAEAKEVALKYRALLNHPDVELIAVKGTGLCREEMLAVTGNWDHPEKRFFKEELMALATLAQKRGQKIFVDAEMRHVEDSINEATIEAWKAFPEVIIPTFQATRRDSQARIQKWIEAGEGRTLTAKIVCGTYPADRKAFPDEFNQTAGDTHQNFRDILLMSKTNPHFKPIACTHNFDLMRMGSEQSEGVGNLEGFNMVKAVCGKETLPYVYRIGHEEFNALIDYMRRRFKDQGEQPPRPQAVLALALVQRLTEALGFK